MTGLDVEQAPAQLQQPPTPVVLQGRVTSFDPQTQLLTILTQAGSIAIKVQTPIPPGTDVTVELYKSGGRTLATLQVPRAALQQANLPPPDILPTQDVVAAPPPERPPLVAGQTVNALLLPQTPPATVEQVAQALESLRRTDPAKLQRLAPPELLEKILMTPDLKALVERLPEQQVRALIRIFTTPPAAPQEEAAAPEMVQKLVSAYQPEAEAPIARATTAPAPTPTRADDDGLLQVIRAQLQARPQAALPQKAAAPQTLPLQAPGIKQSPASGTAALAQMWEQEQPAFAALGRSDARNSALPPDLPRNMYRLQIVTILPPNTPPRQVQAALYEAAAVPDTDPPQAAQVHMETTEGQPILKTPTASFAIAAPVRVAAGSMVIFRAVALTPEETLAALQGSIAPIGMDKSSAATPGLWPALHEALRALQQADPVTAHVFGQSLPTPTARLTPTALFFLSALKAGVVGNWLGENTIRALQDAGRRDLVDRLGDDFGKMSAQARDPLPDAWRAVSLPLLHDEQASLLQFYVRQQYDRDAQGEDAPGLRPVTRFIVNLRLSRMGELQLDGLLRKHNFDMILRTQDKLSFEMRQGLMQAFANGLEQAHMQGSLGFQTRAQSWITVEQAPQKGATV